MLLLSRGLADLGHRVVACAPAGGALFRAACKMGLETRELPSGSFRVQWRSSRELRRIARQVSADVVHAHHTKGHNIALLATIGGGFPPLVVKRGVMWKQPSRSLKYNTNRVAAVAALTEAIGEVLVRSGVRREKIRVLRHCVDLPELRALNDTAPAIREELGLGDTWPVVGSVGNARPEKGFQVLIEAAPDILSVFPEARFVLVGAGTGRFESRLCELGIRSRFILTGHRGDVAAIMSQFDLFVFSGQGMDSVPNVLLEAMAVAKPIVATRVDGIHEPVGHNGNLGRTVSPGMPGELASAVVEVLSRDRDALREMGENARARVARLYRMEDRAREAAALYESLVGRN